jgi:predicted TIM-barrel fold metal-dependent hydrolase
MRANRVIGALAVGMGESVGGYREAEYAGWVTDSLPGVLPIAWWEPGSSEPDRLSALGYRGLKIHPRRCGIDFRHPVLPGLIRDAGMPVLLCTYNFDKGRSREGRQLDDVLTLLDECGSAPVVLLHGGVLRCLEWAEAIRPYPNVLLDLSFTMTRFAGSSLDFDMRYLFDQFDQRLCVGSDHPELSLNDFRARFDTLSDGIEEDKAHNIGHRNLERLFGLEEQA